jgi:hypothetical protein
VCNLIEKLKIDRGRVAVQCANVAMLIGYAYRLSPDRITGPNSMMGLDAPRFDIEATIPQDASQNQVPEMFQALLADRFKLRAEVDSRRTRRKHPACAVADFDPDSPPSTESLLVRCTTAPPAMRTAAARLQR